MTKKTHITVVAITGVVVILFLLIISLWGPECPRQLPLLYAVCKVILALGGGAIASIIPGFIRVDNWGIKAGGAIAVAVLIFKSDLLPAVLNDDRCRDELTINCSVTVDGKLSDQVIIGIPTFNMSTKTNQNGTATIDFKSATLPEKLDFRIQYTPKDAQRLPVDTMITVPDSIFADIKFAVFTQPVIIPPQKISGWVRNKQNKAIEGAIVKAGSDAIDSAVTGYDGAFILNIPTTLKFIKLYGSKKNLSDVLEVPVPSGENILRLQTP